MSYVTLFMLVTLLGEVVEGLEVTKVALKPCEPTGEGILIHEVGCISFSDPSLLQMTNNLYSLDHIF